VSRRTPQPGFLAFSDRGAHKAFDTLRLLRGARRTKNIRRCRSVYRAIGSCRSGGPIQISARGETGWYVEPRRRWRL